MTDTKGQALHFHMTGRVQGVWFRASTQHQAERLGLTGWVRNLPDGRVEGWAEGPEDRLDALEAWLAHGPDQAQVTSLSAERVPAQGHSTFSVRR